MDSATQDLLYQKLDEYIYDEEKIVTCASIVRDLKVSIKDAKTVLTNFVDDSRSLQRKEFYLTYLLSGSLKNGKGCAVYLIKEDELSEKKSLFEKVSSEMIFSIQRNKQIDFNIIALVDKNSSKPTDESFPGFVIGKNCIKRSIKKKVLPPPPKEVNYVKENKSFFQKIASNGALPKTETQGSSKELSLSQEKQTKGKASGMMANFLKCAPKANGNTKLESKDLKLENKPTEKGNTELKKQEDEVNCKNNEKENDEKMDVDEDITPQISQKTSGHAKAPSKKRKKENKNMNTSNKKRKRIQEICDSDSDDIFENEEKDEDVIEKSDEEPEPVVVIKPVLLPKNKRRKAVDKTYMDEDGFMVTTTEYIYESASEDEEKPSEKPVLQACPEKPKVLEKKNSTTDSESEAKNGKTKGKKNSKKAATGKQTTLMNFFKKN